MTRATAGFRARVRRALGTPLPRAEDLPGPADYAGLGRSWRGDVVAGVTVGIVALPLALAFGVSAGVGAEAGLVTAIVAGLVAAVFGGSNVQVSGPTGAMVVVLAPIVATSGTGAVALLSVLAGALLLLLGVARVGRAVAYIPWPVIEGFTVGIGVIIFLQQVPAAVASPVEPGSNAVVAAARAVAAARWAEAGVAVGIAAFVAATMIVLPRIHRALPASLIAIVAVTVFAALLDLDAARIGALPASLPAPSFPELSFAELPRMGGAVVSIAVLAAIESLLSARVASGMPGPSGAMTGPFNPDRELVGQGLASIASGVFGGMPATGAIARTAVNVRSGGRTRLASVVHALVLLGVVYLASGLVGMIPLAALAGVLMVTAARMIPFALIRRILASTRADALAFAATAVVTVAFDLIVAIEIGIAVTAVLTLRKFARLGAARVEAVPGDPEPGDERIAIVRLDGPMFFVGADRIQQELADLPDVRVVILRFSNVQYVDATGAQALAEAIDALARRGIAVLAKGIRPEHLEVISSVGALDRLRARGHLFESLDDALRHARRLVRDP